MNLVTIDFEGLAAGIRQVRDKAAEIEATAGSADGLVTATVDARGRLLDLDISPAVYRELGSTALAESIVDTASAATRRAQAEVAALFQSPA